MTGLEAALILVGAVGSFAGGVTGALRGHRKVAEEAAARAISKHERACQLRAVAAAHLADELPTFTPSPQPAGD